MAQYHWSFLGRCERSQGLSQETCLFFVKDSCGRQEILILKVVTLCTADSNVLFFLYKISWRMRKHPLFFAADHVVGKYEKTDRKDKKV